MNSTDTAYLATVWQKTLSYLEKSFNNQLYETWVKETIPLAINETTIELGTPKKFIKDWFENRYLSIFKDALKSATDKDFDIIFINMDIEETENTTKNDFLPEIKNPSDNQLDFSEVIDSEINELEIEFTKEEIQLINKDPNDEKEEINIPTAIPINNLSVDDSSYSLNPKYVFSTFVIGNSNRLAHAASMAVAEAPAQIYNPFFIYGGVGLGKTHLMHAIGHSIRKNYPHLKVAYISTEKFTNELITSIRDGNPESFRQRYRYIDVLLVDDIQFLAKKERTQEEFFHTFNILHGANKQIILSSDRPPREIQTLEDRLRSRFEWGLITDIQTPDLETRIAVLRKKAQIHKIEVPNEVILYIASRIENNIRELEGAFIRVLAYSSLCNKQIDIELTIEALKDIFPDEQNKQITIKHIKEVVSSYFKIKVEDLSAKNRTRNIAYPRQIAMYLCRELTQTSLPKIGEQFGGRDHTTVIYAHEKINKDKSSDIKLNNCINSLIKKIESK